MSARIYSLEEIDHIKPQVHKSMLFILKDFCFKDIAQKLLFSNSALMSVKILQTPKGKKAQVSSSLGDDSHNDIPLTPKQLIQTEINRLTEPRCHQIAEDINHIHEFSPKLGFHVSIDEISEVLINNGIINTENPHKLTKVHSNYQTLLKSLFQINHNFMESIKKITLQKFQNYIDSKFDENRKYEAIGCWISNLLVIGCITTKEYFNLLYSFIKSFPDNIEVACAAISSSLFISGQALDDALVPESNFFYRFLLNNHNSLHSLIRFRIVDLLTERNRTLTPLTSPTSNTNKSIETSQIQRKTASKVDEVSISEELERIFNEEFIKNKTPKFTFSTKDITWKILNQSIINSRENIEQWEDFGVCYLNNCSDFFQPQKPDVYFENLKQIYDEQYSPNNLAKLLAMFIEYVAQKDATFIKVFEKCIDFINEIIKMQDTPSNGKGLSSWGSLVRCFIRQDIEWTIPLDLAKLISDTIYKKVTEFQQEKSAKPFYDFLNWIVFYVPCDEEKPQDKFFEISSNEKEIDPFYLAMFFGYCIPQDENDDFVYDISKFSSLKEKYKNTFIPLMDVMFADYPEEKEKIKSLIAKSE